MLRVTAFAILAAAFSGPVMAQEAGSQKVRPPAGPQGWVLTLGLAPVFGNAWQGSRDTALSIFPDIRLNYNDTIFASVPDGIGWNAVNRDGWKAGPVIKPGLRDAPPQAGGE
jgi:outer membrane protein